MTALLNYLRTIYSRMLIALFTLFSITMAREIANSRLVEKLIQKGYIKSTLVEETLKTVDRGLFTNGPEVYAYQDSPQQIGWGATISAPHMHAYALEMLKGHLRPHSRVLDVGSGSGYLTVCMSHIMNYTGTVIGIDHIPQIVDLSIRNINSYKDGLIGNAIHLNVADGRHGYPEYAPYKAIHVGAAAETLPEDLIDQLDVGGRLIVPVGPQGRAQHIIVVDKKQDGSIISREDMPVGFIPLTDREKQDL